MMFSSRHTRRPTLSVTYGSHNKFGGYEMPEEQADAEEDELLDSFEADEGPLFLLVKNGSHEDLGGPMSRG